MRVEYNIEQRTLAQGAIELEPEMELAWHAARSEAERRAIVEPLVRQHAAVADDWVYDMSIGFSPVPEE